MKIKKLNKFIKFFTGDSIIGVTLAPFGIYLKKKYFFDYEVRRHETIHWKQQMEMLIIPFYLWYVTEWFIRLFMPGNAYRNISFEREAYGNEENENYLEERKKFAWIKYLNKKN